MNDAPTTAAPRGGQDAAAAPGPGPGVGDGSAAPAPASPAQQGEPGIPSERVPIGEALNMLNEHDPGRALLGEWGGLDNAEENLAYARGEADAILKDLAAHDPSAARALIDSVNGMNDSQLAGLLRVLAARGRDRFMQSAAPVASTTSTPTQGASPMPNGVPLTNKERVQAEIDRLHDLQNSADAKDRRAYRSDAVQRRLAALYEHLHGDDVIVGGRRPGVDGAQRTY